MGTPSAAGRTHARAWVLGIALLPSLSSLSCFEPPVRENMVIVFNPDGTMQVEVTTRLRVGDDDPATVARLDGIREAIARQDDSWSRRLQSLAPVRRRETYEYDHEVLSAVSRTILSQEPEAIRDLFSWTQVGSTLNRADEVMTLEMLPASGGAATLRQERIVREGLDRFSASISSYLAAASDLYDEIDERPERARPCFEELFEDLIEPQRRSGDELTEREADLVGNVKERMSDVWEVLVVPEGEAFTIDELSHLVYDPFPAPLQIEVAGTVEEVEGFERRSEQRVAVRGLGLWDALESLRGRWIEPDPLLIFVEESRREGGSQLDPAEISGRRRRVAGLPDAAEVKATIEQGLRPADVYRLKWRLPRGDAADAAPPDQRATPPAEPGR